MISETINNIAQLATKKNRSGSLEGSQSIPQPIRKASGDPIVYYNYMLNAAPLVASNKTLLVKSPHVSISPNPQPKPLIPLSAETIKKLKEETLDI